MKYYKFIVKGDEKTGGVLYAPAKWPYPIARDAEEVKNWKSLVVELKDGMYRPFHLCIGGANMVSEELKELLVSFVGSDSDIEFLPVKAVSAEYGNKTYYLMHFKKIFDVIDPANTVYVEGTDDAIIKLALDYEKVKDLKVFNSQPAINDVIVSEDVYKAIRKNKLDFGLLFQPVMAMEKEEGPQNTNVEKRQKTPLFVLVAMPIIMALSSSVVLAERWDILSVIMVLLVAILFYVYKVSKKAINDKQGNGNVERCAASLLVEVLGKLPLPCRMYVGDYLNSALEDGHLQQLKKYFVSMDAGHSREYDYCLDMSIECISYLKDELKQDDSLINYFCHYSIEHKDCVLLKVCDTVLFSIHKRLKLPADLIRKCEKNEIQIQIKEGSV